MIGSSRSALTGAELVDHSMSAHTSPIANAAQPIGIRTFALMAKAAGYKSMFTFDDAESFITSLDGILAQAGPVLIQLRLDWSVDDGLPLREIPLNPGERGRRLREILTSAEGS